MRSLPLRWQPRNATKEADFVAFLDAPRPSPTWQVRQIHTEFHDPTRNAKIHKILPHRYFPQARYSLWIDGSVTIRFPYSVQRLIELYLADCDLAVFKHRTRTCLYQEADICLRWGLDDPAVVWRQVARYTQEGYPPNAGLAECTVVLRRHTRTVEEFNEAWWEEIATGSRRDQLSFPYAAAKAGLTYGTFPGTVVENPLFHLARHTAPLLSRASDLIGRQLARRAFGLSAMQRASLISLLGPRLAGGPSRLDEFLGMLARGSVNKVRRTWLGETLARVGSTPRARRVRLAPADRPAPPLTPARRVQRRVVAFGPARDVPSWSWVGFDTARELSKYYDVVLYDSWSTPPACDVLLIVKERPPEHFVDAVRRNRSRLVYCPIDAHRDHDHLTRDADIFRACTMVLLHSERLLP
ncbi:MAG TPA: glycosyltransferase domain-containing protein, partial [Candidatus Methylomirabilis sp.]|nr:glycosyltransferase domain-containing protein [Candidatus Methylomirabilis sp.]